MSDTIDGDVRFSTELWELYGAAGRPAHSALVRQAAKQQPPIHLNPKSLSDWLGGVSIPSQDKWVKFLTDYLEGIAARSKGYERRPHGYWTQLAAAARKAKRSGRPRTMIRPEGFQTAMGRWPRLRGREPVDTLANAVGDDSSAPLSTAPWTPVWNVPRREPSTVDRPGITDELVRLLTADEAGKVGVTTGLYGAGGFGKTTVAIMVCHRPQVRQRFPGGVLWVTVGDAKTPSQVAALLVDLCHQLGDRDATFTSAEQAGYRLGQLFDHRPAMLLVIDDVWHRGDLAPFLLGGEQATRLVTTRTQTVLPDGSAIVMVDELADREARQLLLAGLPPLPAAVVAGLLGRTCGWALLTALINGQLRRTVREGADPTTAAHDVLNRLVEEGPSSVDVGSRQGRDAAVSAAVQRSLAKLEPADQQRYLQLGVLPEDADIPMNVLAGLWGLSLVDTRGRCEDLAELSLLARYTRGASTLRLHDVLRDFSRHQLGAGAQATAQRLLNHAANQLPKAPTSDDNFMRAWWLLPDDANYLWQHLSYHLDQAGRSDEMTALLLDLRWVQAKLARLGMAEIDVDLARCPDQTVAHLRTELIRNSHLLAPIQPSHSHADILVSRLGGVAVLDQYLARYASTLAAGVTRMTNGWPLPDHNPALTRAFIGHIGAANAVAIAPDNTWLATAGDDGMVRIWDAVTGMERAELVGHAGGVNALAIAPDNTWLATAGDDGTVRVWGLAGSSQRAKLVGHTGWVNAVAIAPDGTWLASAGNDGTVRIWDAHAASQRAKMVGHVSRVNAVAIAPDGTWLATAGNDRTIRIWDANTAVLGAELVGHPSRVKAIAIAPDGTWIAAGGNDGTVRIWDRSTATVRAELVGHLAGVRAMTVAPDGTWIATAGDDATVRIWDTNSTTLRADLVGHTGWITSVAVAPDGTWIATAGNDRTIRIWDARSAIAPADAVGHSRGANAVAMGPDGSWIATAGNDRTVRIWDARTGGLRAEMVGHTSWVNAIAVAPDGSWIATAANDRTVRIWDPRTATQESELRGHTSRVNAVAIAPDGTWIATAGNDRTVRIWDARTGAQRAALVGHSGRVNAVAIAPDGTWLVSVGNDGTVRIWDARTATERAELVGHTGRVKTVAIARDGTWLATAGDDRAVRIWDADATALRAELFGHRGWVTAVAIAPDGSALATASNDRTVRLWNPSIAIDRAKARGRGGGPTAVTVPEGGWRGLVDVEVGVLRDEDCLAAMRVDSVVNAIQWSSHVGLFLAGTRGLYAFNVHFALPRQESGQ